jgi:F-box-like
MLPDDILLEIFDIYVNENEDEYSKKEIEEWQTLVHVCRRWRSVVFRSPRRLNLRLVCTSATPARDTLDVWPPLPLLIRDMDLTEDNEIFAVLERSDRVVEIDLDCPSLETVLAAMQVPFLELTRLVLCPEDGMESVLPDSFLGGSAPRLQFLSLAGIPFPGLLKLLLSTTRLVDLHLWNIPHSGYISPEAIVAALSTMTSLENLALEFESPRSRPDWANRRLPPPTRSVLPVLIYFSFKGACEYLEDLVTCIDTPRLNELDITLFNQIIFDTPQSIQFISRAPTLETFEKAYVVFGSNAAWVHLSSQTSVNGNLVMKIPCIELDWQVSSMEQVCSSCLPPLSPLEDLYISEDIYWRPAWQDNIENTLLLELLRPFTGVKNLYLSEKLASLIIPALQELTGGRTTEVLPTLQNIFLEKHKPSGTIQAGIQQFAATRQGTGHPIAVSRWNNSKQDMEHYHFFLYD